MPAPFMPVTAPSTPAPARHGRGDAVLVLAHDDQGVVLQARPGPDVERVVEAPQVVELAVARRRARGRDAGAVEARRHHVHEPHVLERRPRAIGEALHLLLVAARQVRLGRREQDSSSVRGSPCA
jgi:hypothetical protein